MVFFPPEAKEPSADLVGVTNWYEEGGDHEWRGSNNVVSWRWTLDTFNVSVQYCFLVRALLYCLRSLGLGSLG